MGNGFGRLDTAAKILIDQSLQDDLQKVPLPTYPNDRSPQPMFSFSANAP